MISSRMDSDLVASSLLGHEEGRFCCRNWDIVPFALRLSTSLIQQRNRYADEGMAGSQLASVNTCSEIGRK